MSFRAAVLVLVLVLVTSCAKKHRVTAVHPAPPQVRSGETGLASWYGHPYHGRAAANGEIYDMEKFTAAHRTLPFGTWVRVTNLSNDKTVDVRITDRGPFVDGRIIDVSHVAAQALSLIGPGVAQVRLDILSAPATALAQSSYAVQVGAFRELDRANRLRASMEQEYGSARLVQRAGSPTVWRVLVGRERSEEAATALAERLRTEVGPAFVVRMDEAPAAVAGSGSLQ